MALGSGIRKKPIPDPESRGQKGTGSRIRIRNIGRNMRRNECYHNKVLELLPVPLLELLIAEVTDVLINRTKETKYFFTAFE